MVIGVRRQAQVAEQVAEGPGGGPDLGEVVRRGVEVEDQPVGPLESVGAAEPGVRGDARSAPPGRRACATSSATTWSLCRPRMCRPRRFGRSSPGSGRAPSSRRTPARRSRPGSAACSPAARARAAASRRRHVGVVLRRGRAWSPLPVTGRGEQHLVAAWLIATPATVSAFVIALLRTTSCGRLVVAQPEDSAGVAAGPRCVHSVKATCATSSRLRPVHAGAGSLPSRAGRLAPPRSAREPLLPGRGARPAEKPVPTLPAYTQAVGAS